MGIKEGKIFRNKKIIIGAYVAKEKKIDAKLIVHTNKWSLEPDSSQMSFKIYAVSLFFTLIVILESNTEKKRRLNKKYLYGVLIVK